MAEATTEDEVIIDIMVIDHIEITTVVTHITTIAPHTTTTAPHTTMVAVVALLFLFN